MDIGEEDTTEAGSIRVQGETIQVVAQTNSRKLGHEKFIFTKNMSSYFVSHYCDDTLLKCVSNFVA